MSVEHSKQATDRFFNPWMFLVLWIGVQAVLGAVLAIWSSGEPAVWSWINGPQGMFVLIMFGLLLGVGIIGAMRRPVSLSEAFEFLSLRPSLKEIRFHWLCLGVVIALLVILRPKALGGGSPSWAGAVIRARSEGGYAYLVAAMVLGPFLEEAIMRGYLYQAFRQAYGRQAGIIIVSLVGVVAHLESIQRSLFAACLFAGIGVLLCYVLDSKRNLMDCITLHVAYNATLIGYELAAH